MREEPTTLSAGDELAGFRIVALVGQGGMGSVYSAVEPGQFDRSVALKVVRPHLAADRDFQMRFEREARIAATLQHRNVIPVYRAGAAEGHLYIAMRLIDGVDLDTVRRREGRLDAVRASAICVQVASALDAAHRRGLVHRDVKPANVLIESYDTDDEAIYLTDFGLVKDQTNLNLTQTGTMVGTIDYMSPEQIAGPSVDARSDVYSLASVFYELVSGVVPMARDTTTAAMLAHVREDAPRLDSVADVSSDLADVVARSLSREPEERHPSAGDFARAALRAAQGREIAPEQGSVAVGEAATGTRLRDAPAIGDDPPVDKTVVDVPVEETVREAPIGATVVDTPAAPAVASPPPPPPAPAPARSRTPLIAGGVVALVIAAAGVAAAAGVFSGDDGSSTTSQSIASTPTTTPQTSPKTSTTPPPEPGLSASAVRPVLDDYERAYSDKSADELSRLLDPKVQRRANTPPARAKGRAAVLAIYARQFGLLPGAVDYKLSGVKITKQAGGAVASGRYTISASTGTSRGRVTLGLVRRSDGDVRIVAIDAHAE